MKWYVVEYLKNGRRTQRSFKCESLKQARKTGAWIAENDGGTEPSVTLWN